MVLIGRVFGPVFGPRGKMPKPIPATADPAPLLERMRRATRLINKGQLNFQAKVGDESMQDEQLAENVLAVLEEVERKITDLGGRLRAIYLKTTMGEPVRLEAR
jgi:large subunit ribosomal protein L1